MQNLDRFLGKRVKIKTTRHNEYIGKVDGYVPALDNEPELEEIDIMNEKDNKGYSLFETEIISIEVLEEKS